MRRAAPTSKVIPSTTRGLRLRGGGALAVVAMVVLVAGMLGGATAKLPDLGSEPRILHPLVIDNSAYLHGGYADGARLLTLPGNAVGVSADRSIIATRSTDGGFAGYRLRDGGVAWQVSGAQIAAHECRGWVPEIDRYWRTISDNGLAWCWRSEGEFPHAMLDLQTGRWTEFDFWGAYPNSHYLEFAFRSFFFTVLDPGAGQARLVQLSLDGSELSSVPLLTTVTGDPGYCDVSVDRIACFSHAGSGTNIFDRNTGELEASLPPGVFNGFTSDGYLARWNDHRGPVFIYNIKGVRVGAIENPCSFIPSGSPKRAQKVLYSNADYQAQTTGCDAKLVGPSGRVFLEYTFRYIAGDQYSELPQAGTLLKQPSPNPSVAISADEKVMAIVPRHGSPDEGIRLVNPSSGEIFASIPSPAISQERNLVGVIDNGIAFWTEERFNPDSRTSTQVLIPRG